MITTMLAASAADAFDVDAATRAYLAMVQGPARLRSDAYFEGGYWLILWGALISIAVNWALLHFGWSARWSAWAARRVRRPSLRTMLYWLPYTFATGLILLPWTIYTDYWREHQYAMSNLTFGAWSGEQLTDLLINLVVGALAIAAIYAVIRRAPRSWWLWGTAVTVAFLTFGALLAPVFISPLFNTYTPMAESPLREEILAMARANNVPADNVYVFDASKQTDRISANVSGLGPTIRISLNDNLLGRTAPEEVKAVMGHELGHYVLNHVWKLIGGFGLIFLFVFLFAWAAAPRLLARYGRRWSVREVADPASLPLLVILFSVGMFFATPLTHSIIRIHEVEADAFGLDAAREPDGFAHVAMRLSEYRKLEPGHLEELIFFDHPSGANRARMSMEWKARHLAELPPEKRVLQRPAPLPVKD
ncbi:STE24 endopeptidase [Sphingomonas kaistensis]|uniref:STE24 endopeptidase n=1 Tax=Sphingomonas kaistensis TaxID=298708 RepID=A0A7X5Y4P0_9SPHN|nr:M48 family metallopeptidase [Sphingomonas kaistensis]NJC05143.1 STE24 endopeptidase [Sphingomonas kaistensis]